MTKREQIIEIYRKVYINSEAELPKEDGNYICLHKGATKLDIFPYKVNESHWFVEIDWYLQPEQSESINNAKSESALNDYAKKAGEDFTKPSGIALGWRACYEWVILTLKYEQSESKEAIETSKALKNIFDDLWNNAYDAEYHHYEYKQANQIIRKHIEAMEEYRQQHQTTKQP